MSRNDKIPAPEFYRPHPALSTLVSHIMIFEASFAGINGRASPFPPTPQNSIHFYPGDTIHTQASSNTTFQKSPECIVVGPQVSRVNLQMGLHHIIVSVAFHPGGLYRLLGIPLADLYDKAFDSTLLLGNEINLVTEQLKEAHNHLEMKNIVEAFLLGITIVKKEYNAFDKAMLILLRSNGLLSMDKAASLSCLSLRQFERRSKEVLGYSPKMFARLARFSKAYRMKENAPGLSWTNIAYTSGYYDQMHMIRDFKEFTGVSPSIMLNEINRAPFLLQQRMML